MPIGFVDVPRPARICEVEARKLMPGKASSVFPTPCRPALACTTHAEANALSKTLGIGINQQTFHLFPKMREVDELLCSRPKLKRIVYEAHPELAFARMNDGKPVLSKKRQPDGYAERCRCWPGTASPARSIACPARPATTSSMPSPSAAPRCSSPRTRRRASVPPRSATAAACR